MFKSDGLNLTMAPVPPRRLFDSDWGSVIMSLVRLLDDTLSIAWLERCNKRTKTLLVRSDMRICTLVAKSYNTEVRSNFEQRKEFDLARKEQSLPPPIADTTIPLLPSKPKRAFGARECHKFDMLGVERAAGAPTNFLPFTSKWRRDVRLKFDTLSPEEVEDYEIMAEVGWETFQEGFIGSCLVPLSELLRWMRS